jgi:hypothetical protein
MPRINCQPESHFGSDFDVPNDDHRSRINNDDFFSAFFNFFLVLILNVQSEFVLEFIVVLEKLRHIDILALLNLLVLAH